MTWVPPADDPALITAKSYADKLQAYIKWAVDTLDANDWYAYTHLTLFAAAWKITGDEAYVGRARQAMSRIRSGLAKITKNPDAPLIGKYWYGKEASWMLTAVRAFETRPEHAQLLTELGNMYVDHLEALPVYWETGAFNRSWSAALLYDIALTYGHPTSRAAEFKEFADEIWNYWLLFRDFDEDAERYSPQDLSMLSEWSALRGFSWQLESKIVDLWCHYAGLITNDGTFVSYGDSGTNGDYMFAVRIAEVAARASKLGQYKWLAHRAFWNGQDRIDKLEADTKTDDQKLMLALAYLDADETVQEIPVEPSTTVTSRQFREWADNAENVNCGPTPQQRCKPQIYLHSATQPSKVVFRAGASERDATFVLQAGNHAGHGHSDAGAVIHYSGNYSTYLCNGVSREDYDLKYHNLVVLQNPSQADECQPPRLVSEQTSVPVAAQLDNNAYARLTIGPYPGTTPDQIAALWPNILAGKASQSEYRHAIGYKNWPVVMDRLVVLVADMGAVVRDIMTFQLPVEAQVGQNWIIGDILAQDPAGSWIIHHVPTMSNAEYPNTNPSIETGPDNLLVWMNTSDGAPIQTLPLRPCNPAYHLNLTRRAWQPVRKTWSSASRHTMTSVLIPLDPTIGSAGSIPPITADPQNGNLTIHMNPDQSYFVFLESPSREFTFEDANFTCEAAVIVAKKDKPTRLYGWQVTHLTVGQTVLWDNTQPTNQVWTLPNNTNTPRS